MTPQGCPDDVTAICPWLVVAPHTSSRHLVLWGERASLELVDRLVGDLFVSEEE